LYSTVYFLSWIVFYSLYFLFGLYSTVCIFCLGLYSTVSIFFLGLYSIVCIFYLGFYSTVCIFCLGLYSTVYIFCLGLYSTAVFSVLDCILQYVFSVLDCILQTVFSVLDCILQSVFLCWTAFYVQLCIFCLGLYCTVLYFLRSSSSSSSSSVWRTGASPAFKSRPTRSYFSLKTGNSKPRTELYLLNVNVECSVWDHDSDSIRSVDPDRYSAVLDPDTDSMNPDPKHWWNVRL
jgi:hypothetical protein